MAIIHNGFIDRKFHDSFKDTGLNDVDIATTKMYKGVKPMWQQLGFDSDDRDRPSGTTLESHNKFYWKNIIPKSYTFKPANIFGIHVEDVLIDDDSDVGVVDGMKTPRTSYKKININDNVSQDWKGTPQPYYPTLPRIDKYGVFTDIVDETILFGGKQTWDGDDELAPITNLDDQDNDLILNVDFDQTTADDLIDKTNLNKINYSQDFQVSLDDDLRLTTDTLIIPDGIETNNEEQAF